MTIKAYPITILYAGEDHIEKVKTMPRHTSATLEAAISAVRDEGYELLSDHGYSDECQFDDNRQEWIVTVC